MSVVCVCDSTFNFEITKSARDGGWWGGWLGGLGHDGERRQTIYNTQVGIVSMFLRWYSSNIVFYVANRAFLG